MIVGGVAINKLGMTPLCPLYPSQCGVWTKGECSALGNLQVLCQPDTFVSTPAFHMPGATMKGNGRHKFSPQGVSLEGWCGQQWRQQWGPWQKPHPSFQVELRTTNSVTAWGRGNPLLPTWRSLVWLKPYIDKYYK